MQDDNPPLTTVATVGETDVIALAAETLRVDRRDRVTGRVRVDVRTEVADHPVSMDLSRTGMRVETIEIGRTLDPGEPAPVQEMRGETTVIPVLEEILVVEKRLVLKAELHLTPVTSTETVSTTVELRRQVATIDRLPADPDVSG